MSILAIRHIRIDENLLQPINRVRLSHFSYHNDHKQQKIRSAYLFHYEIMNGIFYESIL